MADAFDSLKAALADRYALEHELGSGGMATVYLARDLKHERLVAVKVLRPELAAALGAERFLQEIKIAANLHHPHILPLYDSGDADGFLYYVMPYEEGQTLRDKLAKEGELPIADAVRILRDVVDALSHAHKHNVVHRDIKPDNVMLSDRHALVTDFGVAKAVSEATGRQQLTTEGVALGTPTYMAPEQAAADPHIDHRADIYAVGAVAYELLTGRPPFLGTTPQMILSAHMTDTPEPVSKYRESVPPALEQLVLKCLEKKAADRWQSAEELLPQLEALVTPSGGTTPIGTVPVSAVARTKKMAFAAAAAAVILAAVLVVTLLPRGGEVALDPELVVVAVFRNETGEPSLDPLGKLAGHGITQGIRGAGEFVRFTPWELALQSSHYVQGEADAGRIRDVVRALAEETGSGLVISGAYYVEGDNIRFQVDVTDAVSGKSVGSPEPVIGSREAPSELVGRLQQRVMGFLAMTFDERYVTSAEQIGRLPTYEAFQEFDEGMELLVGPYDNAAALPHFLRAFDIDSTFFTALIYAAIPVINLGGRERLESLLQVLASHGDQLSEYDRHWMRGLQATLDGDHEATLRAFSAAAQIAPQSRATYLHAYLLELLNRPREALEVLRAIDPKRGGMRGVHLYWLRVIEAHHLLDEHVQELEAVRKALKQYPDAGVFRRYEARALAALGRVDEVRQLVAEVDDVAASRMPGEALRAHGHIEAAREVFGQTVEARRARLSAAVNPFNKYWLAIALKNAEEWAEAWELTDELVAEFPEETDYAGLLGVIAARLGDRERALHISAQIGTMDIDAFLDLDGRVVWQARIAAALGEHAEAVRLLQKAFREGWVFPIDLHHCVEFESLRNDPDFQELMRPKG